MNAINITAFTEDAAQINAIKAMIEAFKIKYSISKVSINEVAYNVEFVAKIKEGETDLKNGKGISMSLDELESLCK